MKIFIKHILRNLEDHIGRTVLMIFTLSVVGFVISLCITMAYGFQSFLDVIDSMSADYDYNIYNLNPDINLEYEDLENLGLDMKYFGIAKPLDGYLYYEEKDKYYPYDVETFDFDEAITFKYTEKKISLKDDEAIVDTSVSRKLNVKTGETILFYDENGNKYELKVAGYYDSKLSTSFSNSIFVNEKTYLKISQLDKIVYSEFNGIYTGKEKIKEINKTLPDQMYDHDIMFVYMKIDKSNLPEIMKYLKLAIVGVIILVSLIFFILKSLVKIIMKERIPIVGSFRSVGASNNTMTVLLISEMATYGLIGGFLGSAFGAGSVFAMLKLIVFAFGLKMNMSKLMIIIIVLTSLLVIIFQTSLSISEILSLRQYTIKDSIFNSHDNKYKRTPLKFVLGVFLLVASIITLLFGYNINYLFGIIGIFTVIAALSLLLPYISIIVEKILKRDNQPLLTMAFDTLKNNKQQVGTNIIIAILTSVSIVVISGFNSYIMQNEAKIDFVKSDLLITANDEPSFIYNDILALDNVDSIASLFKYNISKNKIEQIKEISFAGNDIEDITFIYSEYVDNLGQYTNAIDADYDKWKNLKYNEVILSNFYRDKYKLKSGDTFVLKFNMKSENIDSDINFDLKIVDFADMAKFDNTAMIVSHDLYETFTAVSSPYNYLFVNIKDKSKERETEDEISDLLSSTSTVYSKSVHIKNIEMEIKNMKQIITLIIAALVGLGLIGIINNQTVSYLQRTKELAILYSTCMSRRQLANTILREILLAYVISIVPSIIIALMLNRFVYYTLDSLYIYFLPKFNILYISILLLALALVMSVIYLSMYIKIKHMNIVEELKYE